MLSSWNILNQNDLPFHFCLFHWPVRMWRHLVLYRTVHPRHILRMPPKMKFHLVPRIGNPRWNCSHSYRTDTSYGIGNIADGDFDLVLRLAYEYLKIFALNIKIYAYKMHLLCWTLLQSSVAAVFNWIHNLMMYKPFHYWCIAFVVSMKY